MNGIKGKVAGCYNQYKVPGMAMVNVVISKSGQGHLGFGHREVRRDPHRDVRRECGEVSIVPALGWVDDALSVQFALTRTQGGLRPPYETPLRSQLVAGAAKPRLSVA